jgi:hypothetical protein
MTLKLADEFGFRGYCNSIARGNGTPAFQARLVLGLNQPTGNACRYRVRKDLQLGRITPESATIQGKAIKAIEAMWRLGISTHVIATGKECGWLEISDGCHMRRTGIGS